MKKKKRITKYLPFGLTLLLPSYFEKNLQINNKSSSSSSSNVDDDIPREFIFQMSFQQQKKKKNEFISFSKRVLSKQEQRPLPFHS